MSESGNIKVYIIATDQSNTSIFVFECINFLIFYKDEEELDL